MDFFRQQDRARRQTRMLIVAFGAAVLAILLAMNVVALFIFGQAAGGDQGPVVPRSLDAALPVIAVTSAITLAVILIASLYRTVQLRGGGSRVARELGGVEVDGSTSDPLRRRLLNIVEEMAIASGVPVPEVFVLDHEDGINAFAAGWSPADAAVAVTRGALENLSREELQGVIAHEFSHVFNGDMRLNIRLMGVLFGILVLAVAGRKMLSSMRYSGGRGRKGGGIVLAALAVMLIGYIGLFFGRWIQAAVSRQREYLADASAIQFTRSPDGIAGALTKIGAATSGSQLEVNTEEVGHMLFASGLASRMFATHPPLVERITRIRPEFDPGEFAEVAASMARHREARRARAEQEAVESARPEHALPGGLTLDADQLAERVGQPGLAQMLMVAGLLAEVPAPLERAAHSDEWAPELILFLLIGADPELREQQLLMVAEAMGSDSEAQVRDLLNIEPDLPVRLRLPLLELAFPALRRRPERQLVDYMKLVDRLAGADGEITVFEYVLARLLNREIEDVLRPPRKMVGGRRTLADHADEVADLIAIFADQGQPDDALAARRARAAAADRLEGIDAEAGARNAPDWQDRLDAIFRELGDLSLDARRQLVEALVRSARTDGVVVPAEYELLRLVAGVLRVPLPVLDGGSADSSASSPVGQPAS